MDGVRWSLFVAGEPKTTQTGSVVRAGGRAFPVRRHTEWSNRIALAAQHSRPPVLLAGPLAVSMAFFRLRPKARRRDRYPLTRPDLENCAKGLLDVLQGIVYVNDAQVVELRLAKAYADPAKAEIPGVAITVAPAP
jgi:Holliday junction resolvase RusA-like endonuclease